MNDGARERDRTADDQAPMEAGHVVGRTPATRAERARALQSALGNRALGRVIASRPVALGSVLLRKATQVRPSRRERRRPGLGDIAWTGGYEVEFAALECTLTVKVHLVPDRDVTRAQADQVKAESQTEFVRLWDGKFFFDDARTHDRFFLRARVRWVNAGGHVRVRLSKGPGTDTQDHLFVAGSVPMDRAHELSHTLGLFDAYIDRRVVRRRNAAAPGVFQDHSVMGNYYAEGSAVAEVKLRHGEVLARDIGRATRRRLTVGYSGPYEGERLVRWRGIRDAAAAASRRTNRGRGRGPRDRGRHADPGARAAMRRKAVLLRLLGGDHVEGVNEVASVVGRTDAVPDRDVESAVAHRRQVDVDALDHDARLPAVERLADGGLQPADHRGVNRLEHEVVDIAAELGPHRSFAGGGADDDLDRLLDVILATGERDRAAMIDAERKGETCSEEVSHAAPIRG